MTVMQLPAAVNPLNPEQAQQFHSLLTTMTPIQQAWVSGFLAASANTNNQVLAPVTAPLAQTAAANFTILYGSQTGNAKHLAQDLAEKAKARGLNTRVVDMADFKPAKIKDEKFLAIVVSTYGEGEPPEQAVKLHQFLASKKAPKLDGAKIAVVGLGDSSYEFFCQTAVDFEERLVALGATVVNEKALFDVDYDEHTDSWIEKTIEVFESDLKSSTPGNVVQISPAASLSAATSQYNKKNPFEAEVSVVQKITGRDSIRDVRHVELSLEGSGLSYKPGDSLGLYFHNDPAEVDSLIETLKLDAAEEVTVGDQTKALRTALLEDLELTQGYPGFVTAYAKATGNKKLSKLAEDQPALRAYIQDRQIFDIVQDHPDTISAADLSAALRKMQPRLYSIASSQAEVEDEVHLTVSVVDYEAFDRAHLGGASGHLGKRVSEGDGLRVFVEDNNNFRLPEDPNKPVIMIGPGTGVAPFRSFLQERDATEAEGKNWLFFGNPNFTQDFLYQIEMQAWLKSDLLNKLSVAFSRDQAEKIYVQDRLRENGAELWNWLEEGAHLYICGDGTQMAKDVHTALLDVVETHGGKSRDEAELYLEALRDDRRYQRDVY